MKRQSYLRLLVQHLKDDGIVGSSLSGFMPFTVYPVETLLSIIGQDLYGKAYKTLDFIEVDSQEEFLDDYESFYPQNPIVIRYEQFCQRILLSEHEINTTGGDPHIETYAPSPQVSRKVLDAIAKDKRITMHEKCRALGPIPKFMSLARI